MCYNCHRLMPLPHASSHTHTYSCAQARQLATESQRRPLVTGHHLVGHYGPVGPPGQRPIFSFSCQTRNSRAWRRNIPPSLRAGTAPDAGARELLTQVLQILPRSETQEG